MQTPARDTDPGSQPRHRVDGSGADSIGVVVADNDPDIRAALAALIADHPRLHLVGTAVDGIEAADLCRRHRVHLALVDVRMPHGGAEAVAAIKTACADTIVAGYTTLADRRTRERLLAAGASAVFAKGRAVDLGDEIVELVER